mmetsp:Transcript_9597/g.15437  ORF Transcript_9597/g.15437 Transcript_9597/m.15437 type:complete len:247 (+) Transcript_9597:277-1017(+)
MDSTSALSLLHSLDISLALSPLPFSLSQVCSVDLQVLHGQRLAIFQALQVSFDSLTNVGEKSLCLRMVESEDMSLCSLPFQPVIFHFDVFVKLSFPFFLLLHSFFFCDNLGFLLTFPSFLVIVAVRLFLSTLFLSLLPHLYHVLLLTHVSLYHFLLLLPVCSLCVNQRLLIINLLVFNGPVLLLHLNRLFLLSQRSLFIHHQIRFRVVLGFQVVQPLDFPVGSFRYFVPHDHHLTNKVGEILLRCG